MLAGYRVPQTSSSAVTPFFGLSLRDGNNQRKSNEPQQIFCFHERYEPDEVGRHRYRKRPMGVSAK